LNCNEDTAEVAVDVSQLRIGRRVRPISATTRPISAIAAVRGSQLKLPCGPLPLEELCGSSRRRGSPELTRRTEETTNSAGASLVPEESLSQAASYAGLPRVQTATPLASSRAALTRSQTATSLVSPPARVRKVYHCSTSVPLGRRPPGKAGKGNSLGSKGWLDRMLAT